MALDCNEIIAFCLCLFDKSTVEHE